MDKGVKRHAGDFGIDSFKIPEDLVKQLSADKLNFRMSGKDVKDACLAVSRK